MLIWCMFILYIVLCLYFFQRIVHWLKKVAPFLKGRYKQMIILIVYVFLASTVIIGGLLPAGSAKTFWNRFGNYWLGTFIFLLSCTIVSDLCTIVLKRIHKKKPLPFMEEIHRYYVAGILITVVSFGLSIYGSIHAKDIKVRDVDVTIEKETKSLDELNIALIADLHMGYNVGSPMIERMVEKINEQNPDIVLIAGDIFDNDYDALDDPEELIHLFKGIKSQYGTYAVYGNHDVKETLVGGFSISSRNLAYREKRMEDFMEKCNITVLRDEVASVANGQVYLIGRLDAEKAGDGTADRESIEKLTEHLDKTKPMILLEHEPRNLKGIANCGVDLMLCGHTHGGQFFPLTCVQPIAWENYYGVKQIGDMTSVVTYGVGVYGPNMRIATDSEIMNITVKFENTAE